MQEYDIYLDGDAVGKARVKREGLYYLFTCTCRCTSSIIYRIVLTCDSERIDLGICVPDGDYYCLNRRIPVKKIQSGELRLEMKRKDEVQAGIICEVSEEKPFSDICRLHKARFEKRNGVPVICIY